MQTSPEIDKQLVAVRAEWDRAELLLKSTQRLRNELIMPSIAELRYAGRRLLDGIADLQKGDEPSAIEQLRDAEHCCKMARFDAVDATILFLASSLHAAEETFGLGVLQNANPGLQTFRTELGKLNQLIVESRTSRSRRGEIYEQIERDLPKLVKFSEGLNLPVEDMRRARSSWLALAMGVVALLTAALGATAGLGSFRDWSPLLQISIALVTAASGLIFALRWRR